MSNTLQNISVRLRAEVLPLYLGTVQRSKGSGSTIEMAVEEEDPCPPRSLLRAVEEPAILMENTCDNNPERNASVLEG